MRQFAELYRQLDETTKTNRKVEVMRDFFEQASPADSAWATYFLCGYRLKRLVLTRNLQAWCSRTADIPDWLFDECRETVGDLAETIALLLPFPGEKSDRGLDDWVRESILPLSSDSEEAQRERLVDAWSRLGPSERLVFNKLVTGEFRVGVSQGLVVRALSEKSGLTAQTIQHRLMGTWEPSALFFEALLNSESSDSDGSRPYPFCLAHPFQSDLESLGRPQEWLIEWKWDGIRAQLIRREGTAFLWSRGEDLITERFPEFEAELAKLPEGTVLDGEVVGWKDGRVLPFSDLQQRIGRKKLSPKYLADVPARFIVFDILEWQGEDRRALPLSERRQLLEDLLAPFADSHFAISPRIDAANWDEVAELRSASRERHVEGFMLKRLDSEYTGGRVTGLWWKWKVDPYSCDAVLIYAQRGHGRRASLYTDYTFGLWDNGQLVPVAKAYSGLTDEEILEVDKFVRRNTLERFGPVHSVKPELVFELAFDGVQKSTRHKSGIAVRFPRMARWRHDKKPEDADTLATLKGLLTTPERTSN